MPLMAEFDHQCCVVQVLHACGIDYAASLNGVKLSKAQAGKAKAAGMVAGEPDVRIYDPPPALPWHVGTMLEMKVPSKAPKTSRAGPYSNCEPHQKVRLRELADRGWHCIVGYGADDALRKLKAAGYPIPTLPARR